MGDVAAATGVSEVDDGRNQPLLGIVGPIIYYLISDLIIIGNFVLVNNAKEAESQYLGSLRWKWKKRVLL